MENALIREAGRRLGEARLAAQPVVIGHPQPVRAGTPAAPGATLTG